LFLQKETLVPTKPRRKTTEITVETQEMVLIRTLKHSALAWCLECGRQTAVVSPEVAARIAGVSARTIYRWVEGGKVHFAETPAGSLLVCIKSLPGGEMAGDSTTLSDDETGRKE
jgi:hypothetical protein